MARWGIQDVAVWHTVLSSLAPTTKKSYEAIFFRFVQFFERENTTFHLITLEVVLRFLQSFVGLSES
jgi:hypothetical protein